MQRPFSAVEIDCRDLIQTVGHIVLLYTTHAMELFVYCELYGIFIFCLNAVRFYSYL